MAMDVTGASMAAAIIAALPANTQPPTPAGQALQLAYWTAVSGAIIKYIEANAVVASTVTLPLAGVATIIAPPSGGPCTGTGSGTGTGTIS